jgi:hypothetical protein
MIDQEMAHHDLGTVGGRVRSSTGRGRWFWVLLDVREQARASARSRTREDAAIEAEDILAQADEALVMG